MIAEQKESNDRREKREPEGAQQGAPFSRFGKEATGKPLQGIPQINPVT